MDDILVDVEQKLRHAYEKQLAAQNAANGSLPATTPEGNSVIHGARQMADYAVRYWNDISYAHYMFLKHVGITQVAYKIKDEFTVKGLKALYH